MEQPVEPLKAPPTRRIGAGLAGVLSLAVFASLALVPIVGVFLAVLAPLPLVQFVGAGRPSILAWGWVAVVLAGLAFVVHSSWVLGVLVGYLVLAAWPALSVELWLRRPWSSGRWAALLTVVSLAVCGGVLVAFSFPVLPADRVAQALSAGMEQAQSLVQTFGGAQRSGEDVVAWALHTTAYLLPGLVALYALAAALWLRPRLQVLGLPVGIEPFDTYRSEEWLPVGFVLGGLGWVFATGLLKWLSANLLLAVFGLYFIGGLAIIHSYLGRRLGGNRWIRLAVALFALQLPVAAVVAALGLIDGFFPLRRSAAPNGGTQA